MAMTFTLVSQLREQLSQLVRSKIDEHNKREAEKERLALEVRINDPRSSRSVLIDLHTGRGKAHSRHTCYFGVI